MNPYYNPIVQDAETYAAANGWDVIVDAPDTGDAQRQIAIMEELIARRVDGIAIGPSDPVLLTETINRAIDKGIRVICLGTDAPDSKRLAYIGTNNYQAGRSMGEVIGRNLDGSGEIVLMSGISGQMSLLERIQGIKDELQEKYPGIEVIDEQHNEGDAKLAVEQTEQMIKLHPDIKAIVCIETVGGPAAVSVWKAKGWQNDPAKTIFAFNDSPNNLQGMRDGFIKVIVAQRRSLWAQGALDALNDLTEGSSVEPNTDTGTVEITLANIDTYLGNPSE